MEVLLQHRRVLLLGDSTTRNLFGQLTSRNTSSDWRVRLLHCSAELAHGCSDCVCACSRAQ